MRQCATTSGEHENERDFHAIRFQIGTPGIRRTACVRSPSAASLTSHLIDWTGSIITGIGRVRHAIPVGVPAGTHARSAWGARFGIAGRASAICRFAGANHIVSIAIVPHAVFVAGAAGRTTGGRRHRRAIVILGPSANHDDKKRDHRRDHQCRVRTQEPHLAYFPGFVLGQDCPLGAEML